MIAFLLQAAGTTPPIRHLPSFVNGQTVQLVLFGIILFLLVGDKIARFFGRFKLFSIGPLKIEGGVTDDMSQTCPHKACEVKRNDIVDKIHAQLADGLENRKSINDNLAALNQTMFIIKQELQTISERLDHLQVGHYKLTFYNEDMPEAERMIAGLRYVKAGNNHKMKEDTLKMCEENPNLYDAVVAVDKTLMVHERRRHDG